MKTEPKDFYQVKWTDANGKLCYGIAEQYAPEAKALAANGGQTMIIHDAITEDDHVVETSKLIPIDCSDYPSEYDKFVEAACTKAYEANKKLTAFGPGAMFRIGVGDGYAHYEVTVVQGAKCRVELRNYSLDRYRDHSFGFGGVLPTASVKKYWDRDRSISKLFGGG